MPGEAKAHRHTAVATKAVTHRAPCIEDNFSGVAVKNTQLSRYVDPTTAAATLVPVGESFVIEIGGLIRTLAAHYTEGVLPAAGVRVYIITASNLLTVTAGTNVRYGTVDEVRDGAAWVNAEQGRIT